MAWLNMLPGIDAARPIALLVIRMGAAIRQLVDDRKASAWR